VRPSPRPRYIAPPPPETPPAPHNSPVGNSPVRNSPVQANPPPPRIINPDTIRPRQQTKEYYRDKLLSLPQARVKEVAPELFFKNKNMRKTLNKDVFQKAYEKATQNNL
jgi:hypothetical protein